jgi:hypothetical protein
MKKICILAVIVLLAHFTAGCGMFGGTKVYDGSGAYSEAHPDKAQPMPYMDPDNGYNSDNK